MPIVNRIFAKTKSSAGLETQHLLRSAFCPRARSERSHLLRLASAYSSPSTIIETALVGPSQSCARKRHFHWREILSPVTRPGAKRYSSPEEPLITERSGDVDTTSHSSGSCAAFRRGAGRNRHGYISIRGTLARGQLSGWATTLFPWPSGALRRFRPLGTNTDSTNFNPIDGRRVGV